MDPMVSARVPLEVRNQVNEGLKAIGSSPTELINCAYTFFLEAKELPTVGSGCKPGLRTLSAKQKETLEQSVKGSTLSGPCKLKKGATDKEILAQRLVEKYECLA